MASFDAYEPAREGYSSTVARLAPVTGANVPLFGLGGTVVNRYYLRGAINGSNVLLTWVNTTGDDTGKPMAAVGASITIRTWLTP